MKLKKIIMCILFLIVTLITTNPTHAILVPTRTIDVVISNVENIEEVEVCTLYPIEYIEYKYNNYDYNSEYVHSLIENNQYNFAEDFENMKLALKNKDYITAISLDRLNILTDGIGGSVYSEYYIYKGEKYVRIDNLSISSNNENTMFFSKSMDYDYKYLPFKYLFVRGNEEKILNLDNYKYSKSYRSGVKDYELKVNINYDELDAVTENDKYMSNDIFTETIKLDTLSIFILALCVINLILIIVVIILFALNKKNNPKQ